MDKNMTLIDDNKKRNKKRNKMKKEFSIKSEGCFTIAKAFGSVKGKPWKRYEVWAKIFVPQIEDYTNFMIYHGKTYNKVYSVFRTLVNSRKEIK